VLQKGVSFCSVMAVAGGIRSVGGVGPTLSTPVIFLSRSLDHEPRSEKKPGGLAGAVAPQHNKFSLIPI
jgi:hypothetical protein